MSYKLTYTGQQVQDYLEKVATGQAGGGTSDYDELENKPIVNQDLSKDGFIPLVNMYYKHTGVTTDTFTQGVIYLYSDSEYKALNERVPTKVSQLQNDSGYTANKGTVTSIAVKMNSKIKGKVTNSGTIDLGTVLTNARAFATSAQGAKADNAMPKSGGTFTGNVIFSTSPKVGNSSLALKSDIPDINSKANLSDGNTFDGQQIFEDTTGTTVIRGSSVEIKASSQSSSQFKVLNTHSGTVINITGEESGLIIIEAPIALGENKGTSGQVLVSQGATNAPQWVTPAIQSASLSGATLTLTL